MDITWLVFVIAISFGGWLTKRRNAKHMKALAQDLKKKYPREKYENL